MNRIDFTQRQLDLFWWFVCERQTIWRKRMGDRLPPPWTDDPVLRTERFTNVYRHLDPGTRYAIEEILERDEPKPDKIFNVMLYRLIGRAETHREIGFQRLDHCSGDHLRRVLNEIRASGRSPFTAAYMVSAYTSMGTRDKVENVARLFERLAGEFQSIYQRIKLAGSAESVHTVLASAYGFGDFLAYQVLVDLLYPLDICFGKPLLPFSLNDWAKAGPGARRGIGMLREGGTNQDRPNAVVGEGAPALPGELSVMCWLRDHQEDEFRRLELDFQYLTNEEGRSVPLSLADIQSCLCEFHKYVKIRDGTGRGRRKFKPPATAPWSGCGDQGHRAGRPRRS